MQINSPTTSDNVGHSPTTSDHVRPRLTMSDTRTEAHTLTSREVLKLFEQSGLLRSQRSIERYCKDEKLDCFFDPDEERYYVTQASADRLIGQLKEIQERHQQVTVSDVPPVAAPTSGPTPTPSPTEIPTPTPTAGMSEEERLRYEAKIKELEDRVFNLRVDKEAKDQVVTMLRDQLKDDRETFVKELVTHTRKVGELETQLKQLEAPRQPTTYRDTSFEDVATRDENSKQLFDESTNMRIVEPQP